MDDLPEEEKPGIPAWVVTFADLMSLLMCFFVLLLSFSEIDAQKFKQIAGELSAAFGVQRDIPALEIPMGTSPIFDKFSPAPPEPSLVNEVRQSTSERMPELDTLRAQIDEQMDQITAQVAEVLSEAIEDGRVQMERDDHRIVIRIEERGSFPSGFADVTSEFERLLADMAVVFAEIPGKLAIEGHTDNVPMRSGRFKSNWDLSAVRASSVANVLLESGAVDPSRLIVKGLADTQPRTHNETLQARALNRRVEIIVDLSEPMAEQEARLRELLETSKKDSKMSSDMESGQRSSVPVIDAT